MTRPLARRWLRPWSLALGHWLLVFPCYALGEIAEGIRIAARETREAINSYDFEER